MKKLSNEEISFFCLELSLMLHAGVGVGEGLCLLAEETRDDETRSFLTDMADCLDQGTPRLCGVPAGFRTM